MTGQTTVCHCFCQLNHPDQMGICDSTTEIVHVEMPPNPWSGAVPMCAPCREAAGE